MKKVRLTLVFVICVFVVFPAFAQEEIMMIEGRAMWCSPGNVDTTIASITEFIENCKDAGFQILVPVVKGTSGIIYWHSKKFPEVINEKWKKFDFLEHFTKIAHEYGLQVHAWLCDFTEGENSPAFRDHPEWAQVNPDGKYTNSEIIQNGRQYRIVWMCPAQRPGYTDQWLLPMIEEIAQNYDVDGIHHDYVRYPGDVAPNNYCYCDYCLEHIHIYNHLYFEDMPDRIFPIGNELPDKTANWKSDPTVRPKNWENMSRKEKVNFLMTASYMKDGFTDLPYFHFEYRSDQITRFVKEAWEIANAVNPKIEMSAAVFKYPMQSGRFIGQRWTDFAPWVDIMMPMCYRAHYPGSFEDYLKMMKETARYENMWAENKTLMYVGFAIHYLYREQHNIINGINTLCEDFKNGEISKKNFEKKYDEFLTEVKDFVTDNELLNRFTDALENFSKTDSTSFITGLTNEIVSESPHAFYSPDRVTRTIEAIRDGGAKGMVVFAGGHIIHRNLWDTFKEAFSRPAKAPYPEGLYRNVSSLGIKSFQSEVDKLKNRLKRQTNLSYTYGTIALILFLVLLIVYLRKIKK